LSHLRRKGDNPYDWVDSIDKIGDKSMSTKDAFCSRLKCERTTDNDYKQAKKVWHEVGICTSRAYHELYNKTDVL